ncbi:TIR domain-containing protein [Pseudoxanthomonas daejeonensis]|uniref:TIR domain-containing protein n=1 Tax=Pseudoxanthomonas daejeonensis TaxID=266062 RepID=UPI001F541590|nr:TIR domain-containing protein [Pseudoxanthomonas daejeonensis]UNK57873.1 TIR domain-containing protein [Pseudoxanthomonas daejeonensis]
MSSGEGIEQERARPTVFLSYSRSDQAQARHLAQALEQAGLDVWWDTLIEGGAAFAKSIEEALAACDAVIVLWSRHSIRSDWVLDEAARGRDLKKLVPLSIDGTEPPLGFRQYQSITLGGPEGAAISEASLHAVLRAVLPLAGREALPRPSLAPVPASRPDATRRGLLVGGGVAVAAAAVGLLGWRRGWFDTAKALGSSVAVLPFENLSGDPDQAYFSDGLSEEVRATLARNQGLKVMAQTSSGKFRDSDEDAIRIAEQLGVAYLLDGSVRWSGEEVRVAADLIDGRTGFSTWTQIFERRIDDVFAVQSEIANTVASALAVQVAAPGTPEDERAASGGTAHLAAFDAYLRGRSLYDLSADEASERAALAQFDMAIALDPGYAAAHAARARSLTAIANQYAAVEEHADLYAQAAAAAGSAVELAPAFADGHSTLGFVLFQGRLDARAARAPFEKSAVLGAGEATVQARWAQYCARTGRAAEAAEAIQHALARDRLNPLIHRAAGSIEYAARRFAESIAPLRQALQMNSHMSRAHAAIGDALVNLGELAQARDEYASEPVGDFQLAGLAIVEHLDGNRGAARKAMDRLVTELGDRVLYQQAQVFAQWGDVEAAIGRLLKARELGDSGLVYARNDPFLDPLRGDSRMRALLDGIGFDA